MTGGRDRGRHHLPDEGAVAVLEARCHDELIKGRDSHDRVLLSADFAQLVQAWCCTLEYQVDSDLLRTCRLYQLGVRRLERPWTDRGEVEDPVPCSSGRQH